MYILTAAEVLQSKGDPNALIERARADGIQVAERRQRPT